MTKVSPGNISLLDCRHSQKTPYQVSLSNEVMLKNWKWREESLKEVTEIRGLLKSKEHFLRSLHNR